MQNLLTRFVKDQLGATAIEYGLIAALIAVGILPRLVGLARRYRGHFQHGHNDYEERLKSANAPSRRLPFAKDRRIESKGNGPTIASRPTVRRTSIKFAPRQ